MFMFQVSRSSTGHWCVVYGICTEDFAVESVYATEPAARARCKFINDLPVKERQMWLDYHDDGYGFPPGPKELLSPTVAQALARIQQLKS
jgi:hypothetical protein